MFRNRNNLEDDLTESKYGMLYEDYHMSGLAKYTKFVDLLVRNTGVTSLLLISDPMIQSSVFVAVNMFWFGWNLFLMPHTSIFTQASIFINSGVLVLSGISCMKLCQYLPGDTLDYWGNIIVNLFFVAAGSTMLLPMAESFLNLVKKFRSWRAAKSAMTSRATNPIANSVDKPAITCGNTQSNPINGNLNQSNEQL